MLGGGLIPNYLTLGRVCLEGWIEGARAAYRARRYDLCGPARTVDAGARLCRRRSLRCRRGTLQNCLNGSGVHDPRPQSRRRERGRTDPWRAECQPDARIVVIISYGNLRTSAQAIRLGATDVVAKPLTIEDIDYALKRPAARQCRLPRTLRRRTEHETRISSSSSRRTTGMFRRPRVR